MKLLFAQREKCILGNVHVLLNTAFKRLNICFIIMDVCFENACKNRKCDMGAGNVDPNAERGRQAGDGWTQGFNVTKNGSTETGKVTQ